MLFLGQCNCRPNIEGEYCTQAESGLFVPLFDYLLYLSPSRIRSELDTFSTLLLCFLNATYLESATDTRCSELVFSFGAQMYDGALGMNFLTCDVEDE